MSFMFVISICRSHMSFMFVIYDGQRDFVYVCHVYIYVCHLFCHVYPSFAYVVYVGIYKGQEEKKVTGGLSLKSNNPTLTGGEQTEKNYHLGRGKGFWENMFAKWAPTNWPGPGSQR